MRVRKPAPWWGVWALVAWLLTISPLQAQQIAPNQPFDNIFGLIEGMWFPDVTCDLNPGWERLIFDWSSHQPNSQEDFFPWLNIPDEWLRAASDCGREIIAVVKNTPAWATDGLPGAGVPRGLYLPVDDPGNVWAGFMRQMAEYYASRGVQRFIIWNEPDIAAGTYGFEFEGDLEDYFQMVKVAAIAARQGNPGAMIHLAGTTYWHDVNSGQRLFTDRLLERIRHDPEGAEYNYYFDALSLHIYFRTDTVYDIVRIYRDLLDQHGFTDKAIWIVETNASPNLDPDWPVVRPQFQITLEQQASFVIHSAALGLAAGAERIGVYKLYDQQLPPGGESFGLLNPETLAPRPAFYAWRTVIAFMNGMQSAALARTERVNAVRLDHINPQITLVMWARGRDAVQVTVTATGTKAYLIGQSGQMAIIRPVDGLYRLTLPGAVCEPVEGCVVGGTVAMLAQAAGDVTVQEIAGNQSTPLVFVAP